MVESNQYMSICFAIPVLNGAKFIRQCLEHILSEKQEHDEVVVVDNGSVDDTVTICRQFTDVKVMICPNITISAVRNRGAYASNSDLYAFIDGDVLLCEGWRKNVISIMSDSGVDATGSTCDIPNDPKWIEEAWYSQRSKKVQKVEYINSGNLIIRREAFEKISGFDENLITDEDCDIGQRMNQANMCVLSVPSIRTIHLGNPKTLKAFYNKQKWRATSSLKTQSWKRPDKPTIMTVAFIFSVFLSALSLVMVPMYDYSLLWTLLLPIIVLLVTVLFRIAQYKNLRYFFELHILYLFYYTARATIILKSFFRK